MTGSELVSTRQDDWSYAKALATARDQLPRKFQDQPGNILVAMEYARSLNLPIMVGITGVQVIDGVPSINAQTMQALVRRAGHKMRVAGDNTQAHCEIVRRDDPEYTYSVTYSVEDAAQAGLLQILEDGRVRSRTKAGNATPWEAHTRAMLRARAISECCRMACADVLAGVAYTPDELGSQTVDALPFSVGEPEAAAQPAWRSGVQAPATGETEAEWYSSAVAAEPAAVTTEAPESAAEPLGAQARARQAVADQRARAEMATQADANTEAARELWEMDIAAADQAGDLETIAQLGRDAYANGWGDLGSRARGIWARVQARLQP